MINLFATLALAAAPACAGDFQRLDLSERMAMVPRRERAAREPAQTAILEISLLQLPLDVDLHTAALEPIETLPLWHAVRLEAHGAPERDAGFETPATESKSRFFGLSKLLSLLRRPKAFSGFDSDPSGD